MNFGIGSFAYRWSIGRPYYRPEDPMTVDQLIDRCVKYGVKAVLLCNNISLHEFTEEQLTAIRDRIVKEGMTVETGSRGTDFNYFKRMLEVSKSSAPRCCASAGTWTATPTRPAWSGRCRRASRRSARSCPRRMSTACTSRSRTASSTTSTRSRRSSKA